MHDPGHLIEAGLLAKVKDAQPACKGLTDFVSIVACASTPQASNTGEAYQYSYILALCNGTCGVVNGRWCVVSGTWGILSDKWRHRMTP